VAEGLRRIAATSGRPQAELIREGVRRLISEVEREPRRFRSLGLGQGGGRSSHWTSDELYRKAMGDR